MDQQDYANTFSGPTSSGCPQDIKDTANLLGTDLIIAFMGLTGSGMSHMIDTLTGQTGRRADSRLASFTTEVRAVRLFKHRIHGDRLVLVDTPGFDDTNKSELDILDMVSEWLKKVYEKDIKLAGIVYLHRITDNRKAGSPQRGLRMFGELCGDQAVKKVVLATTMWDKVYSLSSVKQREIHNQLEKELFETHWKSMVNLGASTARFENSPESAWKILDTVLKQQEAEVLLLQEEIVDFKRALNETQAGKTLYSDLQKLLAEQQNAVRCLAEQDSPQLARQMEEELKRIRKDLDKTFDEMKNLKIPMSKRIMLGKKPRPVASVFSQDIKDAANLLGTDLVIAFMGLTGSGMSHMIDTLTGQPGRRASSRLESCTADVRAVRVSNHPTYANRLVLVDTPGFDNTNTSDSEILEVVSKWLQKVYEKDIKLAGIVYLHRITDNRMTGSPHRNLRMFSDLCGDQAVKKVVLVTTMWDKVYSSPSVKQQEIHNQLEKELFENYWKPMMNLGASTARFLNTLDSASDIINNILKQQETEALLLQEEIVDLKKALTETQAGKSLYSDLQKLLSEQRDTVRSLAQQARDESNPQLARQLEAELKRIQKDFDKTFDEMKELKIPMGKRIMSMFFGKKSRGRSLHF